MLNPTHKISDRLHVWAFPVVNGVVGAGQFVAAALLGGTRPDIGAAFGSQFANSGFNFLMTGLSPGQYYVGVYARSNVSFQFFRQIALVTIQGAVSAVASLLSAGGFHTCVVTTDGGARCWGSNSEGQLGDGTKSNRGIPGSVSGLLSGVA